MHCGAAARYRLAFELAGIRHQQASKHLAKGAHFRAPSDLNHLRKRTRPAAQLVADVARKRAVQIAVVEHQSTDTLRMSRRVGNGYRPALAQPNEGKAAKLERIDQRL